MKFKAIFAALALAVGLSVMTGCSTANPNAGYEGVLIEKPWIFGHGGVDPTPVTTGMTFTALSTDVEYVSMQPISAEEHFTDLMSSDGVPLEFDSQIILQVTDSVRLISKFGTGWYPTNIQKQFQNFTRQEVRKHNSNDTAINSSAIDDIDAAVTKEMADYLKSINIPVNLIKITVGRANPPDAIKHQRIETAQQEQRILTEAQRKLAEDARKAAELSRAEADNAYRNAMSLSPDQFLQLENIHMKQNVCTQPQAKCIFTDGKQPLIVDGK